MNHLLFIFAGLLIAVIAIQFLALLIKKQSNTLLLKHLSAKPFMTGNETEFFLRLTRALPDHYIFPQVALNALIKTKGYMPTKDFYSLRNAFDRKVADYVVCNRQTFSVVAIIELDDSSHNGKGDKDAKRDTMLNAAGYRTLRFQSKAKPSEQEIAEVFKQKHGRT